MSIKDDFYSFAALSGEPVVADDIATDQRWSLHRDLVLAQGLRACWAMPLRSGEGAPLGSFMVYSSTARPPAAVDLELATTASQLASIAIEQRQKSDQLAFQAQHDALTGLPNRILLEERLQQALVYAQGHRQMAAVLYIDLDRFKEINDTLGHAVGDLLLKQVAHRLLSSVRHYDTLARMGGDEFTMVLTGVKNPQSAQSVAQNLIASLALPFIVEGRELFITASIGISVFPRDGEDAARLQRNADVAMYRAKSRGKNNCQHFAPEMNVAASGRMEMENLLRRALEQHRLELYYQPEVLLDGTLTGFEALIRLHHPQQGLVLPDQFIPIAEEGGLIIEIGTWVLDQACQQAAAWQRAGFAPLTLAVNVSALQFARPDFVGLVARALERHSLPAKLLELELTESVLIVNSQDAMEKLIELRELGVGLVIDDFGTGYSSLAYLQRLPIDRLKIDRMFIQGMFGRNGNPRRSKALVQTIIGLAHSLKIGVVAEGVETRAQLEVLQRAGCDRVQGFLFHRPMPAVEAENFIKTTRGVH
jgi:diguanylate cyclase (GGDEF)-like protein